MSTLDEQEKSEIDKFCSRIDRDEVFTLHLPNFYDSTSYVPKFMNTLLGYSVLGFAKVAASHYVVDHLTGTTPTPKLQSLHASVDKMDEDAAARLSSYLSKPAAGVKEIVVTRDLAPFGNQSDAVAVSNTLIREGILMATTLQKIRLSWVNVEENDLLALLHSNNVDLRELQLEHVVILPAKKRAWFPPNLNGTTLKVKELTFEMSSDETEEGLACIARLVRRLQSSGSLDKVTLIGFDGRLPSHAYGSLTQVHTVVLNSCFITKNQLLQLALGLEKHRCMKSLAFPKCRFSRRAARMLGKVTGKAQGLESLEIGELKSPAAQASFLHGVRQSGSVRSLSITDASIQWKGKASCGLQFFASNCSLVSLRLSGFGSLTGGNTLSGLCGKLQRNQTLRSLHLSCIENFEPVSQYIRQNSSLQELIVEDCDMTRTDSNSLLEVVAVSTTLRKLCLKDCHYVYWFENRNVRWGTILPKMKWLSQLHLEGGFMPDMMLGNLVSGLEGNHNFLQFSSGGLFTGRDVFQERADKCIHRNLREHATLALVGSLGAQLLPRVVSSLSSLSTDRFLLFEVLAQHCGMFCEDRRESNTPTP